MKYRWITNVGEGNAFERLMEQSNANLEKDFVLDLPLSKYETWNLDKEINTNDTYWVNGVLYVKIKEIVIMEDNIYDSKDYVTSTKLITTSYPAPTQEELIKGGSRGIYERIKD